MKNQENLNQISFSTLFAICCFIIGTILLIAYRTTHNDILLVIGFFYVIAAVFFNAIILLNLLYQLATIPRERTESAIRILILLSNIPVAILYYNLVL